MRVGETLLLLFAEDAPIASVLSSLSAENVADSRYDSRYDSRKVGMIVAIKKKIAANRYLIAI